MTPRFRTALLAALAASALYAPAARAGEFVVTSCGESPTNETTGWTLTSAATLDTGTQCPPDTSQPSGSANQSEHTGIYLTDKLGGADTPGGSLVSATFNTAAGTTITRARIWRWATHYGDPGWTITGATLEGTPLDSCTNVQQGCDFGGPAYGPGIENGSAYANFTGLSTAGIRYRLSCNSAGGSVCTNGATVYRASLSLFGTKMTVSDPSAPTQQTPSGPLWTASGYQQGALALSGAASDNTGISNTQLIVDNAPAAESPRGCNYSHPIPCTNEPGAALALNTATITDGPHAIAVRALDAAANPASVTRPAQLLTDNTAPAPPSHIRPDGPASRSTNSWTVQWDLAPDTGSPIVRAHYAICPAGNTTGCTTSQADGQGINQTPAFALPGPGRFDVHVYLEDQLGHTDATRESVTTLEYTPPSTQPPGSSTPTSTTPPPTTITPPTTAPHTTPPPATKSPARLTLTRARRTARTVRLTGTTTTLAAGTVRVSFSQRIAGRTLRTTRTARLSRGRFTLTFHLTGRLARTHAGTLSVAYAGSSSVRSASLRRTLRRP